MGIADALSDAVEALQEYLSKSDEDATKPLRSKFEKLLADMDAMRAELDAISPKGPSEGSS
ncbi:MAG TPA: hypothetical protein VNX23_17520 [Bradyrhizobium sp.]|jgi:hypothetical protein|uniref:hypothetical protein n=1 Tax=Bradyrhizobium sp. TaxID=376 RepID=UPI002B658E74|nr:hypothetical protein [Bradyrhizobium sp.]HXB79178.1 hypothetical protein [Bradyrhizobium sp.]